MLEGNSSSENHGWSSEGQWGVRHCERTACDKGDTDSRNTHPEGKENQQERPQEISDELVQVWIYPAKIMEWLIQTMGSTSSFSRISSGREFCRVGWVRLVVAVPPCPRCPQHWSGAAPGLGWALAPSLSPAGPPSVLGSALL